MDRLSSVYTLLRGRADPHVPATRTLRATTQHMRHTALPTHHTMLHCVGHHPLSAHEAHSMPLWRCVRELEQTCSHEPVKAQVPQAKPPHHELGHERLHGPKRARLQRATGWASERSGPHGETPRSPPPILYACESTLTACCHVGRGSALLKRRLTHRRLRHRRGSSPWADSPRR